MKTFNIVFAFVFVCFVQEVIYANECNDCVNEIVYNYNSLMRNVSHKNLTKVTLGKRSYEAPFLSSNIFDVFSSTNISEKCKDSLIMYFNDLISFKPWAVEMFDATGKPPGCHLLSTTTDFGSSEDCLGIKVHSDSESILFKGQFCMIHLQHPLFQPSRFKTQNGKGYTETFGISPNWIRDIVDGDMTARFGLYLGVCTPSVCTEEDLYSIMNAIAEPTSLNVVISDCEVEKEKESEQWPISAKFAIVIVLSFLILCVIGTSLDLLDRKQAGRKSLTDIDVNRELLKCFSIYRNTKAVFTIDARKTPVDCTYGLKTIFCLWVMMGHYVVYPTFWKELRYKDFYYIHEFFYPPLIMVIINNGVIVVEGFFYLSGFLLSFTLCRKLEQTGGNIDIWENISLRYWRLTPVHLFVLVTTFILPLLSSGPLWDSTWEHEKENCFRNGWKNLLYLHNFDPSLDICWLHTWFIGVTIQCAIIFIPLMVLLYKYPKFGIFVSLLIMLGSMAHTYKTSIENGFVFISYNSFRIPERTIDFISAIYVKTIFHLPSNLVGMLSGWIVLKYKNRKLSKEWLITGWIFYVLCNIITFYFVYLPTTDQRIGALYNATRNTIYCFGLSWVVYACATGNGGFIDKALSWKALVPISRLSYSLYLVHPLILLLRDSSVSERLYMDKLVHVMEVIPYVLVTFIFGFILYVTVEEPCSRVYDLLKKIRTTSKQTLPSPLHPPTKENMKKNETKTL